MSDKGKAARPGVGMTREQLVRAHFDGYRDLIWKEVLEPKFDDYDLNADSMRQYRQQWNAYTEKRDWAWWVQNAARMSNNELKSDIAECHDKIEAIDGRRLPPELRKRVQSAFQEILNGDNLDKDRSIELAPARTKSREM
jgi:hypothetical protein